MKINLAKSSLILLCFSMAGAIGGGLYERRVQCKLKQMKDIGAINSVTSFFEDIVRYAEHADGEDPTWGFSDAQGARLAGSALRRFILALLPKDLGKDAERAAFCSY
jgi:hypothetical protein